MLSLCIKLLMFRKILLLVYTAKLLLQEAVIIVETDVGFQLSVIVY